MCGGFFLLGANSKEDKRKKLPILDRVEANGKTEGAQKEVPMQPEVPGKLASLYVRENQDVVQGTVLAELDNEVQKQQLNLAKAQLDVADVQFQQAEADLRRAEKIFRGHASNESAFEDKLYKKLTAEARCKEARVQVHLAEARLAQTQVVAKGNGR